MDINADIRNVNPLISVVTPSFNQGKYVEDTILSVLRQNYRKIQHIIMDGGSNDGTIEVLNKYRTKAEIISEPDKGQVDAILKGFKRARGEILTWLNSDDVYIHKNTLSKVAELFARHPHISVVSGSTVLIDSDNKLLQVYRAFPRFRLKQLMLYDYIRQPATFFRAEILQKVNLDKSLNCAFDYDFWLKLSRDYKFFMVRDILAGIRRHTDMKTIRLSDEMDKESANVVNRYRDSIHVSLIDKVAAPIYRVMNKTAGLALITEIYQRHREHNSQVNEFAIPLKLNGFTRTCLRQLVNHKGILF